MKKFWIIIAATIICATTALANPRVVDRVAAVVNDDMISLSEVEERAAIEISQLREEGRASMEKILSARRHALDELIADRLLAAEEKNSNIDVTDQEVDFAIEDVRKQNNMDAATFERALNMRGQSMDAYREKMKKDLAAMKLIGMKVRSKIKVSEEDLKSEYARQNKLDESDFEVHINRIVIQVGDNANPGAVESAKKLALEVTKRARSGEDFGELAKKYSDVSKENGGDVGFIKRGEMVGDFDRIAFSLKPGEVSDPIRSASGWHIIKVVERRSGNGKSFEQVRDELREKLFREQMQRHTEQYVSDLRKQAIVDIKIAELNSNSNPK